MKKLFFVSFLFFVFVSPAASALEIREYNITFEILPDMTVKERVSMAFSERLNRSTLNYVVLGDVSDIRVRNEAGDLDYTIEKTGNEHNVRFVAPGGTGILDISFIAKDLVFYRDDVYGFLANLEPPASDKVSVTAYLPKGFGIYREAVSPEGYGTLTDGERIYIGWEFERPEEIAVSFKFYSTHTDYHPAMIAAVAVIAVFAIAYLVMHYRRRVKREFMRGFSEDERKVLARLREEKIVMQKKLEKEFGFSRAKMTRVVKSLESKGLVEKERVGRSNRLFHRK